MSTPANNSNSIVLLPWNKFILNIKGTEPSNYSHEEVKFKEKQTTWKGILFNKFLLDSKEDNNVDCCEHDLEFVT